ncbi:MAG: L-threonylcarbamoyladenylate synthase [Candidatus Competibacterales bacterium]|nr:L-threonylcarbamoyladenylate synthase [Candidatus Competibacterales bacterium]
MSQFFQIHPDNPQPRLLRQAVAILQDNGVIAYPTDSSYALGWRIGDKTAMERVAQIRQTDKDHNFTVVCRDLSEIATYGKIDNAQFRLLKAATPGPFTFILSATSEVPRRLQNPKRKTVGLRVPDNTIVRALIDALGEPLMSSTLILPGEELPLNDPHRIRERLEHRIDLVIDGGSCPLEPTTVLDLTDEIPRVLRQGRGDATPFL